MSPVIKKELITMTTEVLSVPSLPTHLFLPFSTRVRAGALQFVMIQWMSEMIWAYVGQLVSDHWPFVQRNLK